MGPLESMGAIGFNGDNWIQLGPFGVPFGVIFGVLFEVPFGVTVGVPFGVQVVLVDDLEAPVEEGGSHEGLHLGSVGPLRSMGPLGVNRAIWGQWGHLGSLGPLVSMGSMEDNGVNGSQWGHWSQWGQLEPIGAIWGPF